MAGKKIVGVDVGGTFIKAGLVSGRRIVKKAVVKTEAKKGKSIVLKNLFKAIDPVITKDAKAIGIGFPAPIIKGTAMEVHNIPALSNTNIAKIVAKKYRKKCIVENDAKCFALAELSYGSAKGKKNIIGITLGTGLGCGIIIDGKLYRGNTGSAGEISKMPFGKGKLEDFMNAGFLRKIGGKTPLELSILAKKGDKRARNAWKEFGSNLGKGLAIVVDTIDPEMIVIGGGISKSFSLFKKDMIQELKKHVFKETFRRIKITVSRLREPGILGAAALAK